jgi:hypothetical protein
MGKILSVHFLDKKMKNERIILRALDLVGYACGIPQVSMFTKLTEELMDSQKDLLMKLEKIQSLDRGELLGLAGSGVTALENYFNAEMSEEFRKRQLRRAMSKFNEAYHTLKVRPSFHRYCPQVAKSIAFCHFLMGHRELARTWVQTAIYDNKRFGYPEKHQDLMDLLDELAEKKYLSEGQ